MKKAPPIKIGDHVMVISSTERENRPYVGTIQKVDGIGYFHYKGNDVSIGTGAYLRYTDGEWRPAGFNEYLKELDK